MVINTPSVSPFRNDRGEWVVGIDFHDGKLAAFELPIDMAADLAESIRDSVELARKRGRTND
ncbi:hypothetical protein HUN08_13210 [Gordonia sp. X0973]|uniref:hypothetical protein n=1 Tax=Gordonia sp. X0973 TaxID=2742602 RepID=UPI000F52F051|nr:hypothetical protein [Gordonia sp. X0973]QKT08034.1 hypothetical protein HUN08_13210 [Gordonia sp. X0973]